MLKENLELSTKDKSILLKKNQLEVLHIDFQEKLVTELETESTQKVSLKMFW